MPLKINHHLTPQRLLPRIERLFELSAGKILSLERAWKPAQGAPVFTVKGQYTSRGWTEWTQGFQFGSALLQYEATGEKRFLEIGRRKTIELMATHVSHIGVHDHGFNNISTYGNLWRLMRDRQRPQRAHRIHKQRVGAVEGIDIPFPVREGGPARRLHRARDLQGQLVKVLFALVERYLPLAH